MKIIFEKEKALLRKEEIEKEKEREKEEIRKRNEKLKKEKREEKTTSFPSFSIRIPSYLSKRKRREKKNESSFSLSY